MEDISSCSLALIWRS